MINIQIAQSFEKLEDLDNEIKVRRELINQMVGNLYPYIVLEEIYLLNRQREKIERIVNKNYEYYGKRRNN